MLTKLEKRVLGQVQAALPLCQRPFADVGRWVGCSSEEVIESIHKLKAAGYIRRYSAFVNYAVLGRVATLVAAAVPSKKLGRVIAAVNSLDGVSHHYLRKHEFNLWFTLQGLSLRKIEHTLRELNQRLGVQFYSLPAERVFKLDARFNPQGPSQEDFQAGRYLPHESVVGRVSLTRIEKKVLQLLQEDFPITERPFDVLSRQSGVDNFLDVVGSLEAKKVIRRIAAVAAYRKIGYKVNVMACFVLPQDKVESAAKWLSARAAVSHCYERRVFDGWPYNLFAMMHAGRIGDVRQFAVEAARRFGVSKWTLLPTEKELKKQPVMIK
jgi:DNA-binding Lrp family transcriptional regulator